MMQEGRKAILMLPETAQGEQRKVLREVPVRAELEKKGSPGSTGIKKRAETGKSLNQTEQTGGSKV